MNHDEPSRPPLDLSTLARIPSPWRVEVTEESPSTNAEVVARTRDGEPSGLVLVTEHQSAGRGRLDRRWHTPPRSALTVSLLVTPDVPATRWPWLPLLTGLAVADVVSDAGAPAGLKWPNDVLVGEAKIAGILVERVERAGGPAAVVGVGLNVTLTAADLDGLPATSLLLAGAQVLDRTRLLGALLTRFSHWYDEWRTAPAERLRASYSSRCTTIGRDVRVDLPAGGVLAGRCTGVDADGRLLVRDDRGTHALGAGDVVHVRASH